MWNGQTGIIVRRRKHSFSGKTVSVDNGVLTKKTRAYRFGNSLVYSVIGVLGGFLKRVLWVPRHLCKSTRECKSRERKSDCGDALRQNKKKKRRSFFQNTVYLRTEKNWNGRWWKESKKPVSSCFSRNNKTQPQIACIDITCIILVFTSRSAAMWRTARAILACRCRCRCYVTNIIVSLINE